MWEKNQIVLPHIQFDVDTDKYQPGSLLLEMMEAQKMLLDQVKDALDEAGVAWIYVKTGERSKPAESDASHIPLVYLPRIFNVDTDKYQPGSVILEMMVAQQMLLYHVKASLDEAGVAWIDNLTKERSKPADSDTSHIPPIMGEAGNTDSAEGDASV